PPAEAQDHRRDVAAIAPVDLIERRLRLVAADQPQPDIIPARQDHLDRPLLRIVVRRLPSSNAAISSGPPAGIPASSTSQAQPELVDLDAASPPSGLVATFSPPWPPRPPCPPISPPLAPVPVGRPVP